MAKPFSLQIFLPFGEPAGLRIVDRASRTGQGIAFPRARVKQALEVKGLQRTGVYILWDRNEALAVPQVYVGQSEKVSNRIWSHDREKDFWTDAVAFTTKDDSLNKAHVLYLESRLVQIAAETGRCTLENGTTPTPPNIGEAQTADTERYLEDLLAYLPVIGVRFFESLDPPSADAAPDVEPLMLTLDHRNSTEERVQDIFARGYELIDGFVVCEGSLAARQKSDAWAERHPNSAAQRAQLIEEGTLTDVDCPPNAYRFTRDYVFTSPSAAAGCVRAASGSGRDYWKDAEGKSLNDLAKLTQPDEVAE